MALISGAPAVADFVAVEPSKVMLVPLTIFQTRIMADRTRCNTSPVQSAIVCKT